MTREQQRFVRTRIVIVILSFFTAICVTQVIGWFSLGGFPPLR